MRTFSLQTLCHDYFSDEKKLMKKKKIKVTGMSARKEVTLVWINKWNTTKVDVEKKYFNWGVLLLEIFSQATREDIEYRAVSIFHENIWFPSLQSLSHHHHPPQTTSWANLFVRILGSVWVFYPTTPQLKVFPQYLRMYWSKSAHIIPIPIKT